MNAAEQLSKLETFDLRKECRRRGILFPEGTPLPLATKRECIAALESPAYAEAQRLGLLTQED